MSFAALVGLGLSALTRNRLRAALTVLGIVIGVAAVIATLAIGQGARAAVQAQIRSLGANTLTVIPGTITASGARGGMGSITTLNPDDALAIKRECPAVDAVAPGVRTLAQVVAGDANWSTQVQGTTADFSIIRQWPVESGVFITDSDVRGAAKVCVLGKNVARELFGDVDPIGATVRLKDIPFRVVGVLATKGGTGWGGDQDDTILVPITTAQRRLMGITHVNWVVASAVSESQVDAAVTQITDLLRQRHRIHPGDNDDFFIRTQLEAANTAEATSRVMTLLLASIAAVSLLVGGIGIMNIMLVSVTERTREIGIRRAIGAKRMDILMQFLVEAAFLSLAGGALGVGLGTVAASLISSLARWPTMIEPSAVALAFGFASMVGLFFGFYPARRASRLDPIEALRYE
ncbi:MAG: FtsX-like permease family protein [Candidatus Eisenbacteria bacterium]|uniref:FtsX-like permease family protein n=1 Tax=Eiseniibacteriota bacterium TaxID=2212470 RepID=A0A538SK30_UNCEI|nr:MAG: FtsX-like permease family protein [Candidatus Eisenbacteria bacterium]